MLARSTGKRLIITSFCKEEKKKNTSPHIKTQFSAQNTHKLQLFFFLDKSEI